MSCDKILKLARYFDSQMKKIGMGMDLPGWAKSQGLENVGDMTVRELAEKFGLGKRTYESIMPYPPKPDQNPNMGAYQVAYMAWLTSRIGFASANMTLLHKQMDKARAKRENDETEQGLEIEQNTGMEQ
jgi:hypothetical protein